MRHVGVGQAARHRLRRELSRSTSPCRAAAWMPRKTCCVTTASAAICGTSGTPASRLTSTFVGTLAARPGGGRRGDAAARCGRAVRADRIRQDGHRRCDDRPPRREHPGAGASHRTAQAVAGAAAGLSRRRQGRGRHHRRRQGQADRQDRHRGDAVAVPPGRGQSAGRELRPGHRGRVPPRRRGLVRRHPEAGQGQVRARPDRHADPPRRPAADHLHAVRADSAHGGQAGRVRRTTWR